MKKFVAIVVLMAAITGAQAQDAITKFFNKYQNDESFSQVNISSRLFCFVRKQFRSMQEWKQEVGF